MRERHLQERRHQLSCEPSDVLEAKLRYFAKQWESEEHGVDIPLYSLVDIAESVSVNVKHFREQGKGKHMNDTLAKARFVATCNCVNPNFAVYGDVEIPRCKFLLGLVSSSHERSDIVVYANESQNKVVVTAEVQSSPMVYTERKATIAAANLLRLPCCTNISITTVTTFALPNMHENQCIVEIEVTWMKLKFYSKLKRYYNGIERIKQVMYEQCEHLPFLPTSATAISKYLIRLSDADCNEICEGSSQCESSRHLLVTAGDNMYKVLYCSDEFESYILYSRRMRPISKVLLFLEDVAIKCNPMLTVYTYTMQ